MVNISIWYVALHRYVLGEMHNIFTCTSTWGLNYLSVRMTHLYLLFLNDPPLLHWGDIKILVMSELIYSRNNSLQ